MQLFCDYSFANCSFMEADQVVREAVEEENIPGICLMRTIIHTFFVKDYHCMSL